MTSSLSCYRCGQRYEAGCGCADGITLIHGDCRDVLPLLSDVALFVTSPPYNTLADLPKQGSGLWGRSAGGAGFLQAWDTDGYEDEMPEPEYQQWQNEIFTMAATAASPTASLFYNHKCRWRDGECLHPVQWFRPEGWRLRQEITWDRCGGMMFNARMFCLFDERILWFVRGDSWKWNQSVVGNGTVWRIARLQQQNGKLHPVQFPIELPKRCIAATTDPGDLVVDLFGGAGTTGRACKDLGRKCVMVELEEKYCAIAARRLAQEVLPFAS